VGRSFEELPIWNFGRILVSSASASDSTAANAVADVFAASEPKGSWSCKAIVEQWQRKREGGQGPVLMGEYPWLDK
jgi:hypothetical protein